MITCLPCEDLVVQSHTSRRAGHTLVGLINSAPPADFYFARESVCRARMRRIATLPAASPVRVAISELE
jgi:hypothetical protein